MAIHVHPLYLCTEKKHQPGLTPIHCVCIPNVFKLVCKWSLQAFRDKPSVPIEDTCSSIVCKHHETKELFLKLIECCNLHLAI